MLILHPAKIIAGPSIFLDQVVSLLFLKFSQQNRVIRMGYFFGHFHTFPLLDGNAVMFFPGKNEPLRPQFIDIFLGIEQNVQLVFKIIDHDVSGNSVFGYGENPVIILRVPTEFVAYPLLGMNQSTRHIETEKKVVWNLGGRRKLRLFELRSKEIERDSPLGIAVDVTVIQSSRIG